MTECCGYTRYKVNDPFRKARAPSTCGQTVGRTNRLCKARPAIHVHEADTWVCGHHLSRAMLPECSVCLNHITRKEKHTLPCGHTFHSKCMFIWENTNGRLTCPLCRASAYKPMPLPVGLVVTYNTPVPDNVRRLTEGMLVELSNSGRITTSTVREIEHVVGTEWWISLQTVFCAPIRRDGTVQWGQVDRNHSTTHLLRVLNGAFARTHLSLVYPR